MEKSRLEAPHRRYVKRFPVSRSLRATMIRDLDGNIHFWNRAAEKEYGVPGQNAVGKVSHHLLNTVFPYPLDQINEELISHGIWEGELIHTMPDGRRVKVRSRWELHEENSTNVLHVIETNQKIRIVEPETAHLVSTPKRFRLATYLWNTRWWWIGGMVGTLLALRLIIHLTEGLPQLPFF